MPKSTKALGACLVLASALLLCSVPCGARERRAHSWLDAEVRAACVASQAEPDVEVVCRKQSAAELPPPEKPSCDAHPSWVPGCPLRTLPVLAAQNGVAKGSMVVAFTEYPELTYAAYQGATAQVDRRAPA